MTSYEQCKSLKKPSYKWAYKFQVIYQATQKLTWLAGKSSFVVNDWSFPLSCYLSRCVTPGSFGLFSPSERVIASFKWDYSPYRYGYFTPVTYLFISLRLMPPAFAGLEIASSMARSTTKSSSSNNSTILSIASSMARSTTKSNSNSSNNQQQQ